MKKAMLGFLTIIIVLATFAGCANGVSTKDNSMSRSDNTQSGFAPKSEAGEESYGDGAGAAAPSDFEKKLVKTADVVIEAKEVVDTYRDILEFARENGGYEFSQKTNIRENNTTIEATIKITPENLDKLINFAGTKGVLISSSVDSEDITDSYYDSKIRLESLRGQLEKYREFLAGAKNIDETIRIQSQIDNLIGEIEIIEGRLSKWDKLVAESTVRFVITQKADPSLKRREINWNTLSFGDMGYLIKSGVVSVLNVLVSVLQWAVIVILVTSPLWIVAIIVIRIAFRKKFAARKQQKKAMKDNENQRGI